MRIDLWYVRIAPIPAAEAWDARRISIVERSLARAMAHALLHGFAQALASGTHDQRKNWRIGDVAIARLRAASVRKSKNDQLSQTAC